jgi:hypothetical protein
MKDIVAMTDGTVLANIHTADQCSGQHCCIHHPSGHHMATWTHRWDSTDKQMWRVCPHQMLHPDPDDLGFHIGRYGEWEGRVLFTHPCDGCCQPLMHKEIEGGTSGR